MTQAPPLPKPLSPGLPCIARRATQGQATHGHAESKFLSVPERNLKMSECVTSNQSSSDDNPTMSTKQPIKAGKSQEQVSENIKKTRVLITGGSGFIGNVAALACQTAGHDVAVLIRPNDPQSPKLNKQGLHIIQGDLQAPPWDHIEDFGPKCFLHAAWITTPGEYMTSPLNTKFLEWSKAMIKKMCERGVKYILGVGSCTELHETNSSQPTPPYISAKRELHQFLHQITQNYDDVKTAWARIYYPFGPGEPAEKLVSSLIQKLMTGQTVTLNTPDAIKDYIYISDVGNALERLVSVPPDGTFEVGSGQGVSVRQLAETIAKTLKRNPADCLLCKAQQDPCSTPIATNTDLRQLGLKPEISLEEGIRKMIKVLSRE